jgi:metal-responsive CopG/Arc/MetJ family transcriptional regulator
MTHVMSVMKVTVSIDEHLLKRIDRLVKARVFHSRSQAVQTALLEQITRIDKTRLALECAKLVPAVEQAMADEGLASEAGEWPEY